MTAKVDLKALITVLQDIDKQPSKQAQLDRLELFLVAAELNPNPLPFMDLSAGLDLLGEVSGREALAWGDCQTDLEPFFA